MLSVKSVTSTYMVSRIQTILSTLFHNLCLASTPLFRNLKFSQQQITQTIACALPAPRNTFDVIYRTTLHPLSSSYLLTPTTCCRFLQYINC